MIRKFGSQAEFNKVKAQQALIPRGREVGLDERVGFTQENLDRRVQSSTLKSHRLIRYVDAVFGAQAREKIYDALNRKHFCEGLVLNDSSMLEAVCEEVLMIDGKEMDLIRAYLLSDQGTSEVLSNVELLSSLGIRSIPTLIIDGKFIVPSGSLSDIVHTLKESAEAAKITAGKRLFS